MQLVGDDTVLEVNRDVTEVRAAKLLQALPTTPHHGAHLYDRIFAHPYVLGRSLGQKALNGSVVSKVSADVDHRDLIIHQRFILNVVDEFPDPRFRFG
jgi:hypothetical protein